MKIAILGGGPAGSTVGALLARRGHDVLIFEEGERPSLIAGESLIPGVIPVLRRLGIEEQVAQIGLLKPGATFHIREKNEFAFSFDSLPRKYPRYAYNVPRPAFDLLLQQSARSAGAKFISTRTEVLVENDTIQLSPATLAQAIGWHGEQPEFVIDATGRRRGVAKQLGVSAILGNRRDVSHFAHYEGFETENPVGQLQINRLTNGWAWRIPLQGKVSFGIVLDQAAAAKLGDSPESRLEAAFRQDALLQSETKNARRVSEVETYGNYQLISTRGSGKNWAAVGDAFGFVDPMLSPGMMLALQGAETLDRELASAPMHEALPRYTQQMTQEIQSWMDLIAYFYDGRIFLMHEKGCEMRRRFPYLPLGIVETWMRGNLSAMASGFSTNSPFSQGALKGFERMALGKSIPPRSFAIA